MRSKDKKTLQKIKGRYAKLSPRQKLFFAAFSLLLFSGAIFVAAELGIYGENGPEAAPNTLDYGLVGYWNFEEGGGQTVYDRSGNGNNGTLGSSASADSADPTFGPGHDSSGPNGTAAVFDGANDYIKVEDDPSLNITDAITLSFWVYPAYTGEDEKLIYYKNGPGFGSAGIRVGIKSGNFRIHFYDGTSARNIGDIPYNINKWYHLVFYGSKGDEMRAYINGVSWGTSALFVNGIVNDSTNLLFGAASGGNYPFSGSLDEVRIYNRALSEDEIRMLYNQKKPILEMKFDEGSGTLAHDESWNGNDGTINGATWTEGKSGTALSFDGTDDYVYTASSSLFALQQHTFSVWIRAGDFNQYRGILETNILPDPSPIKTRLMTFGSNEIRYHPNYSDGGSNAYVSFTNLPVDTWIHLEATWDGAKAKGYLNGVKIGEINYSTASTYAFAPLLQIGKNSNMERYFNGLIDNVRIYNYARTADEVLADYNDGKAAHLGKNNQDLNYGLVGYWNMEEGGGQTIHDRSGNGNDGTLGSSSSAEASDPTFGPGHDSSGENGTGMALDGADDYAGLGSWDLTGSPHTVSFWMKSTDDPASLNDKRPFSGNYYDINFISGNLQVQIYDSAFKQLVYSASNFSANTWYHILITSDTNNLNLYVDGVLKNTNTTFALTSHPYNLNIGANYAGNNRFFKGSLDEVRIYDRALSEDEIRMLYNQKKPILEMKFDEGSGTVAHDESFNDNDGTISGATWAEGKTGTALSFDGTDDYVNAGNSSSLKPAEELTVTAWVNPVALDSSYRTIVSTGRDNYASGYNLWFHNGSLRSTIKVSSAGTQDSGVSLTGGTVPLNSWSFVSFTYSVSGNTWKHYINGQLSASRVAAGAITSLYPDLPLVIGAMSFSLPSHFKFNGSIDSVRIYNYARTADEVLTDYKDGKAAHLGEGNQDLNHGLLGYWNMEEGGGQTVYDRSGNGNDGTLGASSSVGTDDPTFGPGHDSSGPGGTAAVFDGTDDYIPVGSGSSLKLGNAGTISAWIYPTDSSSIRIIYGSSGGANVDKSPYFKIENNLLGAYLGNGETVNVVNSGLSPDLNKWSFVVLSWDGTNIKVILNSAVYTTPQTYPINFTAANYAIGRQTSWTDRIFKGSLDEVRIYNRALSEDEVRLLYNQKKPILEMKFDEGSGTTAYDESFNDNDGTINGATWVDGKSGTALSFDGVDDYVIANNAASLNMPGDYSISMWVYNRAGAKSFPTLLNREGQSGTNGYSWIYTTGVNEADINFQYANGSSPSTTTFVGALGFEIWNHLTFVSTDSSESLTLFVDGQQFSTVRTLTNALPVDGGDLYLGTYRGQTTNYPFYGSLDNVRIYNYARTPEEILTDYNAGKAAHLR